MDHEKGMHDVSLVVQTATGKFFTRTCAHVVFHGEVCGGIHWLAMLDVVQDRDPGNVSPVVKCGPSWPL